MEFSPLLVNLGAGAVLFAVLLIVGTPERRRRAAQRPGEATEIVIIGLASVNITGVLGLVWLAAETLYYDGIMVIEHVICAVLIAIMATVTAAAAMLNRRNRMVAAIALLALTAVPTIAAYGFLLYLESNPIDMR